MEVVCMSKDLIDSVAGAIESASANEVINAANDIAVAGTEQKKHNHTAEVTCPHCNTVFEVEIPAAQRRGVLVGIALEDMTIEQLKREKVNAHSVLYKGIKRNCSPELVARNQARLNAVKEALAAKGVVTRESSVDPAESAAKRAANKAKFDAAVAKGIAEALKAIQAGTYVMPAEGSVNNTAAELAQLEADIKALEG